MNHCPKCREATVRPSRRELCVNKACPVVQVKRNNRREAWAYNAIGEVWVYNPRGQVVQQPYPNSVEHLRFGRGTKEHDAA